MKKLISLVVIVVALVVAMSVMASAYTVRLTPFGEKAATISTLMTTVKDAAWTNSAPNGPADNGFVYGIKPETAAANKVTDWTQVYAAMFDSSGPDAWHFMAFVDNAEVNTSLGFNLYGANLAQIGDIIGQMWTVEIDGQFYKFKWDETMIAAATPAFTYTWTDTSNMVGVENAKLFTIHTVPEPAGIVAMLTGVAGLGGFAIRRKK